MNGRQLYEQARAFKRAKRQQQLKGVTATCRTREAATVLQFPTNKEAGDGAYQNDQA